MDNIKKKLCIVALLFIYNNLSAQIGCMDNSKHTKETSDYKIYSYVQCNCDCKKYKQSLDRNICSNCKHYHDSVEKIICKYKR